MRQLFGSDTFQLKKLGTLIGADDLFVCCPTAVLTTY